MKRITAVVLGIAFTLGLTAGCGKTNLNPETDIVFTVFNGGYGSDWAKAAAEAFNAQNDKYKVHIDGIHKDEWYALQSAFSTGTANYDIYLNEPDFREAVAKDWFEDLTDLYSQKPDGTKTVYESLKDRETDYLDSVYKIDGKYWGIPFNDGFSGFVYDHQIFLEKGFLIADGGGRLISGKDEKLSAGRDGRPGTVDDGHPANLTEYELMLDAIKDAGWFAFLWSGKFSYYTDPLYYSVFAEYDGKEAYYNAKNFTGDYTNPKTGEVISFTRETGYDVFKMQGRYEALNFMDTYLADPLYYHPSSVKSGTSHTDAQKTYIYGNAYDGATADKQAAFLYEGVWWENEARANFNSLSSRGKSEYAYGARDYRMMMLPDMNDAARYNGYALSCFDNMSLFVKKQSSSSKLAAIKEFLLFLQKEEQMRQFTSLTGGLRPFEYELTQEDKSKMTKFAVNAWDLYNHDDAFIVRIKADNQRSEVAYYADLDIDSEINGSVYTRPINVFERGAGLTNNGTAADYFNGSYNYYKKNWTSILNKIGG
jgi:hypothetical protein